MKSVMDHSFSQIPNAQIQRSVFNRSHGVKTTFDAGYLIPFYVDEALPGDTFKLKATLFCRLSTPIVPFMDNLFLDTFFFAVPNRLLWENWERFNGAQDSPGDSTDFLVPEIPAPVGGWLEGSLADYFGIPTRVEGLRADAWWHRAYNSIWQHWFRDQNLQDSAYLNVSDADDTAENYPVRRRGKRHDYFTSGLPWPQKGDAVMLPLGTTAPVIGDGTAMGLDDQFTGENYGYALRAITGGAVQISSFSYDKTLPSADTDSNNPHQGNAFGLSRDPAHSGLIADLSSATAATINSIRLAFQMQRLLERDARGGTRYVEMIKSHFRVTSPDFRMQRPEYLGGSSQRISINPVQQTSSTDATSPQGNLAAYGVGVERGTGFNKSFTEHCVIIGLVNVRADLTYQQGLNRMFSRQTRWDYYLPVFAHLGEQEVYNKEIFAQNTAADNGVFCYQERWAEYRYKPSIITGKFRSTCPTTLDVWHLSQEFGELPVFNDSFIQDNPPIARVVAVPSEPHFLMDAYLDLVCARPMPAFSVPGMLDHF